jgi:hypothetical protein
MSKQHKGINEARLKTIYSRQDSPSWEPDYMPSILATPQEAPRISHAFTLTPAKLNIRETHLLSTPERNAGFLGLYHPQVVGLQEQRILSPEPCHHPLWTFPGIDKTDLPPLKGIIDVAERLGYLDILPKVKIENPQESGEPISVVFPWVGDLLWAVRDITGMIYCVNWPIKDTYQDFKRPAPPRIGKTVSKNQLQSILARHEIEKVYYEDAQIRTIQVANEGIDHHVVANLRQLFRHHRLQLQLTEEQREEILHKFRAALETGIPPIEVILHFIERERYTTYQCRSLYFQAVWNRELRVDLFQPILINRPQRPETRDVIDVYADWFRR